jgi:hypothetical protein
MLGGTLDVWYWVLPGLGEGEGCKKLGCQSAVITLHYGTSSIA